MRIEKINENKIKVTISIDDLEERNIDLSTLTHNSPAAQELFWDMMEQAEAEFGFNASNSQLVVETIPDSEDSFIVTITRMDEDGDFESFHKYIKSKYRSSDVRVKKKNRKLFSTIAVYTFRSFEDLCQLCSTISSLYTGESTLYKFKNAYYLILTRSSINTSNPKIFDFILSEYGQKVANSGFYDGYLNEYGSKIIEGNAIEVINSYF